MISNFSIQHRVTICQDFALQSGLIACLAFLAVGVVASAPRLGGRGQWLLAVDVIPCFVCQLPSQEAVGCQPATTGVES